MNETNEKQYNFKAIQNLKYGENPHQKASLYSYDTEIDWEILSQNTLTYNDILNSTKALEICAEFFDVPCCAIVKNEIPSSIALAKDLEGAYDKAFDSDPVSPFNSTIAFTRKITIELAKKLSAIPYKTILAPDFDNSAIEELNKIKNLKIIKINTPYQEILKFTPEEIKLTPFGALIQNKNDKTLDVKTFKVMTKKKPEQAQAEDMIFAFKIAKHVKSTGVIVAKDLRTIGICASQTNVSQAIELALAKVCDSPKESIIATGSILNSVENIQIALQNRVIGIIQPFGSKKDNEIIETADKYEISMISTGIRHLKH